METSLKSNLTQPIRYNPKKTDSTPNYLGTIGKTSWSLLPKWSNSKLSYLEVSRTDTQGYFEIEATFYILPKEYSNAKCKFTEYIEDGQTTIRLESKWATTFPRNEEIRGDINIRMCKTAETSIILPKLSVHLLGLLNNPDYFPDATLMCGTAKILVHKGSLSRRSSVFAAMFMNKMQDGIYDIFTIEDLEENVFQSTLKYIYSGKTDHISSKFADDILLAAEKYQLDELKSICIDKLKSSMTGKNAIRIFLLGQLYDSSLQDSAMKFICNYVRFSEMENTRPWKILKTQHPELAIEMLTSFVNYLQLK